MTLDQLAERLGGEISGGQVLAPGPEHSAKDRSLAVKLDDAAPEGFVVHSFAADDPIACRDYVRQRLGLPEFKPKKKGNSKAAGGDGEWKLIREHIYRTADGTPHLRKRKYLKPDGGREFPQARWSSGKWVDGVPKTWPKLLYRLPELLKAPPTSPVYITEGEGDADSLAALGFVATSAGGVSETKSWEKPEFVERLKGRRVVIVVDSDQPGREYGERVARALDKVADSLKVVDLFLEDKAETNGRDVSDFLKTDRAGVNFVKAVKDAPLWEPSAGEGDETSGEAKDDDADDKLIAELAALPAVKYERERKKAAEKLGVRAPILDRLVADERVRLGLDGGDAKQGRAIAFAEPEPWPDRVGGPALLDELATAVRNHVVLDDQARDATALWAVHTYIIKLFSISPKLFIRSAARGCGKSTLLDVLAHLAARPMLAANITTATAFRIIEMFRPTLLIDEVDSFLKENEELRRVLNASHRYDGVVPRLVGEDHEPRNFSVYTAIALAGIGGLHATLLDRSVIIDLQRRKASEPVASLRIGKTAHLDALVSKILRWVADNDERIGAVEPAMPPGVINRLADNWHALLAIADTAGGKWPERARAALLRQQGFSKEAEAQSLLELLLADIYKIFTTKKVEHISSTLLAELLADREDRPWAEYGRNEKPITPAKIAYLLRPLHIAAERIEIEQPQDDGRMATVRLRGYQREQFAEVFDRFSSSEGGAEVSKCPKRDEMGVCADSEVSRDNPDGTLRKSKKPNNDGLWDTWTLLQGGTGDEVQTPRGNSGDAGLPQHAIRRLAGWYEDQAADQYHATGEVDRAQLDADLRRILAEREAVFPEFIEVEFNRIVTMVFSGHGDA